MMHPPPARKPEEKKRVRLTPIIFFLSTVAVAILLHRHLSPPPPLNKETFIERYGGGVAVVTGAARGIGREFAWQLASIGMDLILVSRSSGTLGVTAKEIEEKFGVKVTQIVEEFGKEGAEERVMQACEGKDVSLYVGNHAPTNMIKESKGLMEFVTNSRDYAVKMAEVTLVSQVKLTHYFASKMASRGKGGIILISSFAATMVAPLNVIYGASKAGLSSMALGLWYELRPRGVDVVRAHVGPTDTPATRAMFTDKGLKSVPIQPVFEVVDEVLRGLGRQHTVTPGLANKISELVLGSAPHQLAGMLFETMTKENLNVLS